MFEGWKESIAAFLFFLVVFGGSCGSEKTIEVDGGTTTFKEYGLMTLDQKDPRVNYSFSTSNMVAAGLLYQSIVGPIYIVCFNLWEPTGLKTTYDNIKVVVKKLKKLHKFQLKC